MKIISRYSTFWWNSFYGQQMLTCRNFEHWKLWVKIGFSHIFTYCTEQHTKSSSYWRHLCGKVALILPKYSGESCTLIYVAHSIHHSFKVEIPQIRKWKCNENLWILQRTAHWSEGSFNVQSTFKCFKLWIFEHKNSSL